MFCLQVSSNTLLHAFLWAAMTGACSACSLSLSLPALSAAWPALLALGLTAALAALPYYHLTLRHTLARPAHQAGNTNSGFLVSTAL